MLDAYLAIISARYRTLLQYRAAAFAGFATQAFWGCLKIMVMTAFFSVTTAAQPMSLAEVVSYIWLGQALLGMLPWSVDQELEQMIRQGDVSYELVRPLDLYTFWFCRTIALRTATTTLRSLPMIVVALLVLPLLGFDAWALQPPPDAAAFGVFVVSLASALVLACAVTMLMHVALVWKPFLNAQPFRGLVDVPFRLYTGNIALADAGPEIAHQLGWAVLLIVAGRFWLAGSMRRIVVQGG